MDTDDLSKEAYYAIITEAECFTHDLTLHYGLLAEDCEDEEEYLSKAEKTTKEILNCNDIELDDVFWGNPPKREALHKVLRQILKNIENVRKIPLEKRTLDWRWSDDNEF